MSGSDTDKKPTGSDADKKPAPSKAEEAIAKGMASIRTAVRLAPPHEDLYAACEALIRHLTDTHRPPTDAERNHMKESAWNDMNVEAKAASEARYALLAESYKTLPAAARGDMSEYEWAELTDAERTRIMVPPVPDAPPQPDPPHQTAHRPTTKAS